MRVISVASSLSLLLLLLLLLFLLKASPASESYSFKSESIPLQANTASTHNNTDFNNNKGHEVEDPSVIGDEKRRIYTGPNPLHNR